MTTVIIPADILLHLSLHFFSPTEVALLSYTCSRFAKILQPLLADPDSDWFGKHLSPVIDVEYFGSGDEFDEDKEESQWRVTRRPGPLRHGVAESWFFELSPSQIRSEMEGLRQLIDGDISLITLDYIKNEAEVKFILEKASDGTRCSSISYRTGQKSGDEIYFSNRGQFSWAHVPDFPPLLKYHLWDVEKDIDPYSSEQPESGFTCNWGHLTLDQLWAHYCCRWKEGLKDGEEYVSNCSLGDHVDGKLYSAQWVHGKKQGAEIKSAIPQRGGVNYICMWENGEKHGEEAKFEQDLPVYRALFKHGRKHGKEFSFKVERGSRKLTSYVWSNGVKIQETTSERGKELYTCNYDANGNKHGEEIDFDEDIKTVWKNGVKVSMTGKRYHEDVFDNIFDATHEYDEEKKTSSEGQLEKKRKTEHS